MKFILYNIGERAPDREIEQVKSSALYICTLYQAIVNVYKETFMVRVEGSLNNTSYSLNTNESSTILKYMYSLLDVVVYLSYNVGKHD